ncbi:type 1 glutamine amidotransferase [Methanoculleus sp. YWC-01]|uniref:Type 1 glutamine amidotransferase n=1 Tax=Methanoculleus nereidis TaxID=2735141 RepID=A0ABU3Z1S9_9EURY|nr:type 1 glutamine amidotransferase domain-containing protein [Methanoculleus sp. YWC-01]MCK9298150.1 type 1 glutamine amidotransferase [Methanoculleus sp.]MDV4342773.1 type 1 glutamine amidotransferase [Methanoculleus sp. YWC-01]PKL56898.1 MAG: protease [Methanomicrobiales archaeon HGW-Methanomicrobiales-6]
MSKIAVLVGDMFEDVEYTKPAEAFREGGHDLIHVGLSAGETVHGKKDQTPVTIDRAASDVSPDDFDALFIPGGYSPDKLRAHDAPVEFVRRFARSGKPILAICHAPQLLITAQVLRGRKITGWKSVAQDIKNAGAEYIDREVVIDDNLVSSRQPDDIPVFIEASLAKLKETAGRKVETAGAEQR